MELTNMQMFDKLFANTIADLDKLVKFKDIIDTLNTEVDGLIAQQLIHDFKISKHL